MFHLRRGWRPWSGSESCVILWEVAPSNWVTTVAEPLHIRGTVKKFQEFFDIAGLVHREFVPPGQTITGHFRDCALEFRVSGATVAGFWVTITHRVTHRLLYGNSSPRKPFLSSPNHHTHRTSFPLTFGCSLLWKWASRRHVSQPWRTSDRMWRPNSGRF
jgi:hypothetical protein